MGQGQEGAPQVRGLRAQDGEFENGERRCKGGNWAAITLRSDLVGIVDDIA